MFRNISRFAVAFVLPVVLAGPAAQTMDLDGVRESYDVIDCRDPSSFSCEWPTLSVAACKVKQFSASNSGRGTREARFSQKAEAGAPISELPDPLQDRSLLWPLG